MNLERWMQAVIEKSHVDRRAHVIRHHSGAVTFGGEAHYATAHEHHEEHHDHPDQSGLFGAPEPKPRPAAGGIHEIPLEHIYPNPNQPRKLFSEDKLRELGQSMKTHGQIQHGVLVERPTLDGKKYMIVAGERRWRAAQIAGLTHYRAEVRDLSDEQIAEISLLENVTRADLSPVEEAQAYRNLLAYRTEEQIANATGKQAYHIRRRLKLLELAPEVQDILDKGQMPPSHGEVLTRIAGQDEGERHRAQLSILRRWVKDGWTLDQVNAAVDAWNMKHSADNTLALFDQSAYKPTAEQRRAQRKLDDLLDTAGKLLKGATDEKTLRLIPALRGLAGRDLAKVRLLIRGLKQLEKAMSVQQEVKKIARRKKAVQPARGKAALVAKPPRARRAAS